MTDMSAIVGAGFPARWVGGPDPYGFHLPFSRLGPLRPCVFALNIPPIFNPANPLILNLLIQTTPTLHSAGVLFLDQSPFYRHYAPLERKAIPLSRPLPFPLSHFPTFPLSPFPTFSLSPLLAPSRFPVLNPANSSILSILNSDNKGIARLTKP